MRLVLSDRFLIIGAFATIYFVWGSTYLANYIAIQSIPPLTMAGGRFFTAGSLIFLFELLRGKPLPTAQQWRNAAGMGVLFLAFGTGGVIWALQFVDTGLTSLVVAFEPLMVVLLLWLLQDKRPGRSTWFGVLLGILGMALLVSQQTVITDRNTILGIIFIGGSIMAWALASIYISKITLPKSKFQSSAIQMLGGGVSLMLFGLLAGEFRQVHLGNIDLRAGLALLYLVFFGSILAFSAFNYLLQNVSADKVATSNYVNPVVALLLGWGFNEEVISGQSLVAALILLTGVFFINARS